jgi:hypothetical protein
MPTELDAFYTEHRPCGELDADVEGIVWMTCDCGAALAAVLHAALGFLHRATSHSSAYHWNSSDAGLWLIAGRCTGRSPSAGREHAGPARERRQVIEY